MFDCSPLNGPSSRGTGGGGASWSVSSFSPAVLASTSSSPAASWRTECVRVWNVEVCEGVECGGVEGGCCKDIEMKVCLCEGASSVGCTLLSQVIHIWL